MIDTEKTLKEFLPHLHKAEWVAVDTEADSLHAYPEKLCLVQIGIEQRNVLLDPLAGFDLTPAIDALRQHQLIMHGADYDLRLLRKTFAFVPTTIFDTMLASRLLGIREFGLLSLVSRFLGVKLEKGPQKANWGRRPLTERMETYARNDTHYLKPLSDVLKEQLVAKGRLGWHQEMCARLILDCSEPKAADPDQVWRVKGSHRLTPRGLAILREIWRWREQEAVTTNKPPYFVLSPETMVKLAAAAMEFRSYQHLFPRNFSSRRREALRSAIQNGMESEDYPAPPTRRSLRLTESERRLLAQLESRRDRVAADLGIDPTLIASRGTLVLLADDWERHQKNLMPWQRSLLAKS